MEDIMIDKVEDTFKIFADKNRIRILSLLQQRKLCVCELAYVLEVTQTSISRHLKKMKKADLIEDERDGFWTNYYLKTESVQCKVLMNHIKRWLTDDKVIQSDIKRLRSANRKKLCCR